MDRSRRTNSRTVEQVAQYVVLSATSSVIVIKGTVVGSTAVVGGEILVVGGASLGTGYLIGKYGVCPVLDSIGDALWDYVVNDGKKYPVRTKQYPSRKRAKDAARKACKGKGKPYNEVGSDGNTHWHAVDDNGNKLTGKDNIHYEYPLLLPLYLLPDDDRE